MQDEQSIALDIDKKKQGRLERAEQKEKRSLSRKRDNAVRQVDMMDSYATGSDFLNEQTLGNVPLVPVDFESAQVLALVKPKFQKIITSKGREITKKEVHELQLEKLRVMLYFYR